MNYSIKCTICDTEIKRYTTNDDGYCPKCGQNYGADFFADKEKIVKLETEIWNLRVELNNEKDLTAKLQRQLADLENQAEARK